MWRRSVPRASPLAAAALLSVLAACGSDGTGIDLDPDEDGILSADDGCPNEPETINNAIDSDGCPDSPAEFYELVRSDVEAYWQAVIPSHGFTYAPISDFQGYTASVETPCGTSVPNNAFYCATNRGVYYHAPLLDGFLASIGDAAPAFVVAHEIGHHIGTGHLGWLPSLTLSVKESELGADCFAGAWLAWVNTRGLLEEADVEELASTMLQIGDPAWTWFDATLHGTPEQRAAATAIGFASGPLACLPAPGGLAGHVFNDVNGNGTRDADEDGWSNVTIRITDHWGLSRTVTTDASGRWSGTGLPIGGAEVDIDESALPASATRTVGSDPDTVLVSTNATNDVAPVGFRIPTVGYALDFTSDYVVVPDGPDLDLTTTWTIEAWIKPRNVSASVALASKWGGCSTASYSMELRAAMLRSGIASCASGTQVLESPAVLVVGEWQHVAITLGNGTLRLYVNGVLQASKTESIAPLNTATDVWLGQHTGGGYAFDGLMDEVRIWNVARTGEELASARHTGLAGDEPGLVAYWRFDEGSGDVASDATGRGNNGRLGSAVGSDSSDPAWASDVAPVGS